MGVALYLFCVATLASAAVVRVPYQQREDHKGAVAEPQGGVRSSLFIGDLNFDARKVFPERIAQHRSSRNTVDLPSTAPVSGRKGTAEAIEYVLEILEAFHRRQKITEKFVECQCDTTTGTSCCSEDIKTQINNESNDIVKTERNLRSLRLLLENWTEEPEYPTTGVFPGSGTGAGVGSGTEIGTGVATGAGTGTGVGVGSGTGVGSSSAVGAGSGTSVGIGSGVDVGSGSGKDFNPSLPNARI